MKILLLALSFFATLPAGAADPAPFDPIRFELPPPSAPQPVGLGVLIPLPVGPVRIEYRAALHNFAGAGHTDRLLDAPGAGYRNQRARHEPRP